MSQLNFLDKKSAHSSLLLTKLIDALNGNPKIIVTPEIHLLPKVQVLLMSSERDLKRSNLHLQNRVSMPLCIGRMITLTIM